MSGLETNIFPYFNDFSEAYKYYFLLFRPKVPVQARELNNIQSIFYDQQSKFADHIFREGAVVKDGNLSIDVDYKYIRVLAASGSDLESSLYRETNFHNKIVQGTSGVKALVVNSTSPVDGYVTFYLKYISGDTTTGTTSTFSADEVITTLDSNGGLTAVTATLVSTDATGVGSAANIKEGIFYIRGKFVIADKQTLILDETSNSPSYRIGFEIAETIVDADDDPTLNDNAAGFPNYNAPGAHRHKIELLLTKLDINTEGSEDFIELGEVVNGKITKDNTAITLYSEIEKTLARRTYDESGDYHVIAPKLDIREFYNDGSNRGIYLPSDYEYDTQAEAKQVSIDLFGVASPGTAHQVETKWRPGSTSGNLVDLMEAKIAVGVDPFKAYVRGYEIRTLARVYVPIDKGRETDSRISSVINTRIGNYVQITNIIKSPDLVNYTTINLQDKRTSNLGFAAGTTIGTAKARMIKHVSGAGSDAIFNLYLFDIQMNEGKQFYQVKQIHTSFGMTADIVLDKVLLNGSVSFSLAGTSLTGVGTTWRSDEQFVGGDYLYCLDGTTDRYFRVTSTPTSDTTISVEDDSGAAFSGLALYYTYTTLHEPQNARLVFELPIGPVKNLTADDVTNNTDFVVLRQYNDEGADASGIGLTLLNDYEKYVDLDDWVVVDQTGTSGTFVDDAQVEYASGVDGDNLKAVTITGAGIVNGTSYDIYARVRKPVPNVTTPRTKTLFSSVTKTHTTNSGLNEIGLGKADIYQIRSIHMASDFSTAATTSDTDITDWYELDNGQRDSFYGIGKIIRKLDRPKPTGQLLITFDYFSHGTGSNFFSVESYPVDYEDIPSYHSKTLGRTFDLRNCLDFRPRQNDTGENFSGSGSTQMEFPVDDYVLADFQYYTNRIDKLYVDQTGQFRIVEGVSGLNPGSPDDPSDGMVTHKLSVRAYTFDPKKDVIVDTVDNKRFTMRDIGKLEKRIENLEYYSSLNLLEKSTADMLIPDANGLDRFKNGFIVDNFTSQRICDAESPDFAASVHIEEGECRPMFWSNSVNLIEENTNDEDRITDHYALTGDLFTLPYEEVVLVNQPVATTPINVNPFNVVSFVGDVSLVPPSDEWKDTERAPDLVINQEGDYDAIVALANGQGTIWNEWQTTWSGVSTTNDRVAVYREYGKNPKDANHPTRWPFRTNEVFRTTTTLTTNQTRTGIRPVVTPKIVTENLGDKVINVSYIPYIRSREVHFKAKGMKPNTRLYPFFDEVDISEYCTKWSNIAIPEAYDPNDTANDTPLVTDSTGKVSGTFKIPNTDSVRFRTGERKFRLTSSPTNGSINVDSQGDAFYRAQGLLETKQATILSTRTAEVAWETVTENVSITDVTVQDNTQLGKWVDPVAETFLVTKEGGCFLTSIDLFFQAKDNNIPVTVEIREVVNGYPGARVIPFSRIVKEAADVQVSENASLATNFTFDSPVYCRPGEFAVVVMSNCNNYMIWKSTMGENKIGTEIPVQDQPYDGVFFKSANNSTWTADQYSDLKFVLRCAEFDIAQQGIVVFTNDELPAYSLDNNPIVTRSGQSKIRVFHKNHGLRSDDVKQSKVTLSGATDVNGIPAASINTTLTVLSATLDSYVVDTGAVATSTGRGGGSAIQATENSQMDVVMPMLSNMVLPETGMKLSLKATSSQSTTPGTTGDTLYVTDSDYTPVIANENYQFSKPKTIASQDNETEHLAGLKSFFLKAILSSTNPNISPVIDLQRISVVTVGNRIDSPTPIGVNSYNDIDIDGNVLISANTNIDFNGSVISSTDSTTADDLSELQVGKYILVSGSTSNDTAADQAYRIISVTHTPADSISITVDASLTTEVPGSAVAITQLENFVDDRISSYGSIGAKYLQKRMILDQPSEGLKIIFAANKPANTEIVVYYKTQMSDSPIPFEDVEYSIATIDLDPGDSPDDLSVVDREYTINNLPEFDVVQVKVAMKSTDTTRVPRLKDYRCVALGT